MSAQEREELILEHIAFTDGIARRFYREFRHERLEFEDLKSAAYLGLCAAAQNYDPQKGASFRSYSFMRIRGAMIDLLRSNSTPFSSRRSVAEAREEVVVHRERGEETRPSLALQTALSRSIEELGISFSEAESEDEMTLTYSNDHTPERASTRVAFQQFVSTHLRQLPQKEQAVLDFKYFKDLSFPDMSPHFDDVRPSWLCRIHLRAMERLRTYFVEAEAKDWLQHLEQ